MRVWCALRSDGTVRKAFKVTATLGCSMNVAPFPYDSHVCSIDIAIGSESSLVLLIPSPLGMDLRDMPEAYEGEALEPIANVNTDTPLGLRQSSVSFPMLIVHDPSYVKITFILMAWALNLVSFGQVGVAAYCRLMPGIRFGAMCAPDDLCGILPPLHPCAGASPGLLTSRFCLQFWISPMLGNMDRAGLAITTILASTVLQADARKSKITTWLDIFFSISIAFQFITFFMSVITAHYVFDPDYESEDLVVEQMMESQRERVRNNNSSRSIKGSQSETYEYDKEGHKMLDAYLVFTDSVLGDEKDILPDRWGRRYVFPAFLVITMVLPFLPNSGNMDISRHPASGRNSSLFVINCVFLTVWLVIVGSRLVINVAISHFNYKSGVRSVKDKYKGVDPHVMEQAAQAG